jgi:small-conductance mechanosensitive channel
VEGDDSEVEETEEGEAEETEEGEEPKFTIKVDGKDITLTQSELIERAQKGTDYTQKTMEVAEQRKAAEAERAQVTEARQKYEQTLTETANRLDAWTKFMESQVGNPPDRALLDYDTAGYLRQQEEYNARRGQLQQAYAARQQLEQEQARERQASINERATATEKVLKDTLPDWNDDTLHALAEYAGKLGLTPQSAEAALLEPGFWQLAHKAKAYDALLAKKAEMKPKTELPKVATPKASNPTPRAEAKRADAFKAYRANPSLDALSKLID